MDGVESCTQIVLKIFNGFKKSRKSKLQQLINYWQNYFNSLYNYYVIYKNFKFSQACDKAICLF